MNDQDLQAAADVPTDMTRRSIWETLDQYPDGPLAILGPPGSGKATLLRHVRWRSLGILLTRGLLADGDIRYRCYYFYASMRD
jgi:hypothetical protein